MPRLGLTLLVAAPLSLAAIPGFAAEKLSLHERTFARDAAEGNLAEVQDAQLAQQKANNNEVKQFANRMVTDHTQANDELDQILQSKGVKAATEPSRAERQEHERLAKLSGAQFDRDYVRVQVQDHEKVISLFQRQADSGTDPQLKAYAQKYLPILQQHLQMAKSLEGKG